MSMPYKDPSKRRAAERRRSTARNARPDQPRAKTLSGDPLRVPKKLRMIVDYPEDVVRPKTRAQCMGFDRPCPFVSCRHHLFLDVSEKGGLKLNFPQLEPGDLLVSCSLDVAEDGLSKLEDAGALMNLTRERVRQIEVVALRKLELKRVLRELAK